MRRSSLAALIILIIAVVIVGAVWAHSSNNNNSPPQSNSGASSSNPGNQPSSGTINIRDMMFTPSQITVAKGGSVTWTNNDTISHAVVDDLSNVGGPDSGSIPPGGTYSFTFNKTGSFQYHDPGHTSMRGTIVVK